MSDGTAVTVTTVVEGLKESRWGSLDQNRSDDLLHLTEDLTSESRSRKSEKIGFDDDLRKTSKQLRVVCISDTHNNNREEMPEGDVLIHAGDITRYGKEEHVVAFNAWVDRQRRLRGYKHVLVVRGNHENSFPFEGKASNKPNKPLSTLLTNATYLEQQAIELEGFRFFGTRFCNPMHEPDLLHPYFKEIPEGLDVLITHGPPKGFLDGASLGCASLTEIIKLKRPKVVVFGHIHFGYGMMEGSGEFEGITFINAAICKEHGNPANAPIVITLTREEEDNRKSDSK
eukprot:TRINITY_DN14618_c0_g1_i1.p1 TRINITY_DN14618_c0_g1~~TRINITY_DN14618_c0_g1_i1.p1  ORF type:complete len:299 (-),score=78.53 TRINITY_DN14618_c0_g1_i1:138-995(-)